MSSMRTEEKTNVKNSVGRLIFVALSILIQLGWVIVLFLKLNRYSIYINLLFGILSLLLVLFIYSKDTNSAFRLPWIILILVAPITGVCIYLLFGHKDATRNMRKRFEAIDPIVFENSRQDAQVMQALEEKDFGMANLARYLYRYGRYPVYQNTDTEFYAEASDGFEAQLAELKKAEKFIFMEYHAIEEAASFERLKNVLADRAKQGVEVRILYDDVGSIGFIDPGFVKRMKALGIQCRIFNPVMPILNIFINNRDHRKITVIDGKVGFTGGYNLADEYFNITHPYGYWKDTGVKLTGDAVKSLTRIFLQMWNAMGNTDKNPEVYLPEYAYQAKESGFVLPYADSPLDGEPASENVYISLIGEAKHRLYIATPYLIISDEMTRALCLAAQRGVDVRLITPGIPDKKMVYRITRSYYVNLVKKGVQVYEYTPGFIHEKQMLCDDRAAIVGTINFDYRSLYHHFENGVFLYDSPVIKAIDEDFEKTFAASANVTEEYKNGKKSRLGFVQCVLRLIAPLM